MFKMIFPICNKITLIYVSIVIEHGQYNNYDDLCSLQYNSRLTMSINIVKQYIINRIRINILEQIKCTEEN